MDVDRRGLLGGATALVIGAAAPAAGKPATPANPADAALASALSDLAERFLIRHPEQATSLGLDKGPREGLKSQLGDYAWDAAQAEAVYCANGLRTLARVSDAPLSSPARLDKAVVAAALELGLAGAAFPFGDNSLNSAMNEASTPYVVSQQGGAYASVPEFLASQHKVAGEDDAEAYLSRLHEMARALAAETDRIERDGSRGIVAPDFILDNAIGQQQAMLAIPAGQSRLVQTLQAEVTALKLRPNLVDGARRLVEQQVYPALAQQLEALKATRAVAGHAAGVGRFKDGEAYYAWLLKVGTSTGIDAAQVHRIGLEQNRAIEAEMDGLLKARGLTQGSVGARMDAMGRDPQFLFADDDKGRAELIAYLNGRIAAVRPRLPKLFTLRLKAPIEVRRVPVEIQDGAGLGYMSTGALDGSRPAIYYVNLKSTKTWPRFSLPTLTFHEGVPGHAWQGAYLTETGRLSLIRILLGGFNGYVEGYGLYAEQLADEVGMYDDDWAGRLGYLQAQRFRAMRLVLDTGLHAQGWSRETAVAWAVDQSGRTEQAMTSEVDRYCASPGQACGYKIGHNEINRLRDKARAAMGARYDIRPFNDLLLTTGPAPLDVFEGVVDAHIAAHGGRAA